MKLLVFFCALQCLLSESLLAQKEEFQFPKREFGFNTTGLISNIIPFDNSAFSDPVQNLIFHKRRMKYRYLRTVLNVQINSFNSSNFAVLKLGIEKKRIISKSWLFHSGFEVFGAVQDSGAFNESSQIGMSGIYGFQWLLNSRIGIGTEGYFTAAVVNRSLSSGEPDGLSIKMNLPKSLLLSFYF